MTNREFFEAIVNANEVNDELKEFAAAAIEKLDATNEARRKANDEKKAEKEAEKAPIREAVLACIDAEVPKTASTLIEEAGVDIKPQAVPALLKPLVEAGVVAKTEIKVTGKGKVRGYVLA